MLWFGGKKPRRALTRGFGGRADGLHRPIERFRPERLSGSIGAPRRCALPVDDLSIQRRSSASAPRFESGLGETAQPKFWALRFEDLVRGVAEKAEVVGGEDKPEKGGQ